MYISDIIEYTNRKKMEETTGKVFARLHQMKSILYKTFKSKFDFLLCTFISVGFPFAETPQFCGGISNHNGSLCSPRSYDEISQYSDLPDGSLLHVSID